MKGEEGDAVGWDGEGGTRAKEGPTMHRTGFSLWLSLSEGVTATGKATQRQTGLGDLIGPPRYIQKVAG